MLLEGSPVSPPDRFAVSIERHGVSMLKAGSQWIPYTLRLRGRGAEGSSEDFTEGMGFK